MPKHQYSYDYGSNAKGRFGPSIKALDDPNIGGAYPAEMRTQLWPLCCGAKIISGFKDAHNLTDEELIQKIEDVRDTMVPDMQVYRGEQLRPVLCFLTLNSHQLASPKIMGAVTKTGFQRFATSQSMSGEQGWFVYDGRGAFQVHELKKWE